MANSHNIDILPNCGTNEANNVTPKKKKAGTPIHFGNPAV
jgi:hypothetical protein